MREIIVVLFLFFSFFELKAQIELDSLLSVWNNKTIPDSTRAQAFTDYIYDGYFYTKPDSAIILVKQLYKFTDSTHYKRGSAEVLNLAGHTYFRIGKYIKALDAYHKGLKIAQEIDYKYQIADILLKLGYIYHDNGDLITALNYYERSLKIFEETNDMFGICGIYNEFGSIYLEKEEYATSLEYYQKSIEINNELDFEEGNSAMYLNVGQLYLQQNNFIKALDYFQRGLRIYESSEDKLGIASGLMGIGQVYIEEGENDKGLGYLQRSLKISQDINDIKGMASTLLSMADVYEDNVQYAEAIKKCQKSLALSKSLGDIDGQQESSNCLYNLYKATGDMNKALVFLEQTKIFTDSIKVEKSTKKLQQIEFSKLVLKDSIATVERERLVSLAHNNEMRQEEKTRNFLFGIAFLILILASSLYLRLRYVRKSKAILKIEKDRSENLLLNILPAEIAEELKEKGQADARDFDMVSILFSDFKGFTQASEKLSAQELVAEINTCFRAFDNIMIRYKIEKIKTIGDAYMAAGGLPVPTENSAKNTVLAALEMQAFIKQHKAELDAHGLTTFEMRVGIHTGPVVAGIVGVKKFQYDIWGDTVNTANRMESEGEVGKVNISQGTYELIKDTPDFTFENRGKIKAKGKGEIQMWFVQLKKEE